MARPADRPAAGGLLHRLLTLTAHTPTISGGIVRGGCFLLPYPAVTDSFHFQKRSALRCPDFPPAPHKVPATGRTTAFSLQKYINLAVWQNKTTSFCAPLAKNTDYEGHYQQLFYIIFSLFGMYVDVEVRTPRGRVDMVMRMPDRLYVMELKLGSAGEAMRQIDLKDYPSRFLLSGLPVVKLAVGFDRERRTLGSWEISQAD